MNIPVSELAKGMSVIYSSAGQGIVLELHPVTVLGEEYFVIAFEGRQQMQTICLLSGKEEVQIEKDYDPNLHTHIPLMGQA